jgi:hypothetical protein
MFSLDTFFLAKIPDWEPSYIHPTELNRLIAEWFKWTTTDLPKNLSYYENGHTHTVTYSQWNGDDYPDDDYYYSDTDLSYWDDPHVIYNVTFNGEPVDDQFDMNDPFDIDHNNF